MQRIHQLNKANKSPNQNFANYPRFAQKKENHVPIIFAYFRLLFQ